MKSVRNKCNRYIGFLHPLKAWVLGFGVWGPWGAFLVGSSGGTVTLDQGSPYVDTCCPLIPIPCLQDLSSTATFDSVGTLFCSNE